LDHLSLDVPALKQQVLSVKTLELKALFPLSISICLIPPVQRKVYCISNFFQKHGTYASLATSNLVSTAGCEQGRQIFKNPSIAVI
jgi:hypothetical protein